MFFSNISFQTLTLYYLDVLTTELQQLGYNHLVFPLLAFGDVITRDIVPDRPMNALIHLKYGKIYIILYLFCVYISL